VKSDAATFASRSKLLRHRLEIIVQSGDSESETKKGRFAKDRIIAHSKKKHIKNKMPYSTILKLSFSIG